MARQTCPGCGAAYNGKRCRNCFYEPFGEVIAHGNHTHKGEPLVIDAPVRKPIPRKDPFGCEKKSRKKSRKKRPLAGFVILLAVINSLLPMLRNWGMELEAREDAFLQPEPEYFHIPEDALELYHGEDITVLAQWPQNQTFFRDFPIYVRNESNRDVTVTARDIQINGYMMESSSLWCEASAGTPGMGMFFLTEQDKVNAGILAIQEISFCLDIYDNESYETIALSPVITLTASLPEGTQLINEPEGTLIFDRDGLQITYLGFSYPVSAYDPDSFEDGALLFHFKNETGKDLEISLTEGCVNGTPADLGVWFTLPQGAKAVASAYTYPLAEFGITQPEQLLEMTFTLDVWENDTFQQIHSAESLTFPEPS